MSGSPAAGLFQENVKHDHGLGISCGGKLGVTACIIQAVPDEVANKNKEHYTLKEQKRVNQIGFESCSSELQILHAASSDSMTVKTAVNYSAGSQFLIKTMSSSVQDSRKWIIQDSQSKGAGEKADMQAKKSELKTGTEDSDRDGCKKSFSTYKDIDQVDLALYNKDLTNPCNVYKDLSVENFDILADSRISPEVGSVLVANGGGVLKAPRIASLVESNSQAYVAPLHSASSAKQVLSKQLEVFSGSNEALQETLGLGGMEKTGYIQQKLQNKDLIDHLKPYTQLRNLEKPAGVDLKHDKPAGVDLKHDASSFIVEDMDHEVCNNQLESKECGSQLDSISQNQGNCTPGSSAGPVNKKGNQEDSFAAMPDTFEESNLLDVLNKLISLDPYEIFMEPVDESSAPNYSKVITHPMCFSVMMEKVQRHQYLSWQFFVDDFERICYNAMKYNQKRSKIWKAAKTLLDEGKNYISLFEKKASEGQVKSSNLLKRLENLSFPLLLPSENDANLEGRNAIPTSSGDNVDQSFGGLGNGIIVPSLLSQYEKQGQRTHVAISWPTNSEAMVEVLEEFDTTYEDFRVDSDNQATECSSSSFTCTWSSLSGYATAEEGLEVQSNLRDGNGAMSASHEDESLVPQRPKKALNLDWKNYRRGIEWRCRWLELRIKELQQQAAKYDRILTDIQYGKVQTNLGNYGSAAREIFDARKKNHRALLRRQRKVDNDVEITASMTRHSLFSRYEKKQPEHEDGPLDVDTYHAGEQNYVEAGEGIEEFDLDRSQDPFFGPDEDSVEQVMWMIESLQSRTRKLRHQLRSPLLQKSPCMLSPKGSIQGPTNMNVKSALRATRSRHCIGSQGSNVLRRRSADYDISNMVMPVNVGVKYVEHIKHAHIETPQWRQVNGKREQALPDSSDEDTEDEAYVNRHATLATKEREQRYLPQNIKKAADASSSKSGRGGKFFGLPIVGDDYGMTDAVPHRFIISSFPKGKRKHMKKGVSTGSRASKFLAAIHDAGHSPSVGIEVCEGDNVDQIKESEVQVEGLDAHLHENMDIDKSLGDGHS